MFYISDFRNKLWYVTDTDDMVTEGYFFNDLERISKMGIEILGFESGYASICNRYGDYIFAVSMNKNILSIYSISTGKVTDKVDFNRVYCSRNIPYLCSYTELKLGKDKSSITVRCEVSVKFDYEFTGLYFFKVNLNTGHITSRLDNVLFICDDVREIARIVRQTYGDCPNFISSGKATEILKSRGLE